MVFPLTLLGCFCVIFQYSVQLCLDSVDIVLLITKNALFSDSTVLAFEDIGNLICHLFVFNSYLICISVLFHILFPYFSLFSNIVNLILFGLLLQIGGFQTFFSFLCTFRSNCSLYLIVSHVGS